MKKELIDFVTKREKRFSGEEPPKASFHSRGYHRYFEGYSEAERILPNGHKKIERVYVGVYHIQELDGKQKALLRIGYVLLFILAAAFFVMGAVKPIGSNKTWYVTIVEAFCVGTLFWTFCALVSYLTSPVKLTIHDFRTSSGSLKAASRTAACMEGAACVMTLLYFLLHLAECAADTAGCAFLFLISGSMLSVIYILEAKVPYREEQSENRPAGDGEIIE